MKKRIRLGQPFLFLIMLTTNIDEDINVTNFYIVRYKEAI